MLLHCSFPHICCWGARPPGCPSDTAHIRTSWTLPAKTRAQHAHTCCSGVQRDSMHLFPLFFSLFYSFYYLISMGFSLATLLCHWLSFSLQIWCYTQYHLQSIKSCTLSFYVLVRVSFPVFLFYLIFSPLSLPLALLRAPFCLWGSFGSDS